MSYMHVSFGLLYMPVSFGQMSHMQASYGQEALFRSGGGSSRVELPHNVHCCHDELDIWFDRQGFPFVVGQNSNCAYKAAKRAIGRLARLLLIFIVIMDAWYV